MFDLVFKFVATYGDIEGMLPIEYEKLCFPLISLSFCRLFRDVSRVRHCVLGCTRFPFRRIECRTKGPIGRRKKLNVYANYKQKENIRTACFTRKSNIRISHNGEMIEFRKAVIFGFL